MKDAAPQTVYLRDYTPFGYIVDSVDLTFRLHPTATRVISKIRFRPDPAVTDPVFFLDGENLTLISAAIDGQPVTPSQSPAGLTVDVPDAPFLWEAEVEIAPEANTALSGLYMSNGMYCTQCEAEGFRRITYYPDRPDVMSIFTVRIEGDLPVLLSNGNPTGSGEGWAEWHDPWPKPAYLFALVAGHLVAHSDTITTMSGNEVALNIWVRDGDLPKCGFAMDALKKSMIWDEQVYGREYDLDLFNIVAVDDFNMGAMENKGLNIFNSSAVLASPETATDMNFERIEAIIAHEYFHNWTGNRITCRDWFQLSLKEGLTVFRDAEFTADMRSAPVKRIQDAIDLRARQFPEDAGPLAHPVRPDRYQEINNFYTSTIYEKGAEVIGMLKTLVGDDAYKAALELYFSRHDGQACTIEDWLNVFQDVTGRDLDQFKRWYSEAGTPKLTITDDFTDGTYTLTIRQSTQPSAATRAPQPRVIPLALGLLGPDGAEVLPTSVIEISREEQKFSYDGLDAKPVPSLLRGFSAPVTIDRDTSSAERAFLLAHDTDPFTRWEAGRQLARETLMTMARDGAAPDTAYLKGIFGVVTDDALDPAYRALMLSLPSQSDIASGLHDAGTVPDPDAIWHAFDTLRQALARQLHDFLLSGLKKMAVDAPYAPDAEQSGKRALAGALLGLQSRIDKGGVASKQFASATNMTLQLSALNALLAIGAGTAELTAFYDQWKSDRLVIDKWFALQVMQSPPNRAVDTARALTEHPDFNWKNPNRFRATIGAVAGNHAGFHAADGTGYAFLADWLIRLDPVNPQTAARMCAAFQTWRRYDDGRKSHAKTALTRIAETPGLSRDMSEMVGRMLG